MHNQDLATLDKSKSWNWGVILFESNCIILHHNTSQKTVNTNDMYGLTLKTPIMTISVNVCL